MLSKSIPVVLATSFALFAGSALAQGGGGSDGSGAGGTGATTGGTTDTGGRVSPGNNDSMNPAARYSTGRPSNGQGVGTPLIGNDLGTPGNTEGGRPIK